MQYSSVTAARFLSRPNRFVALVEQGGQVRTVHVKNTGRCAELLHPGAAVYLTPGQNPARKTPFDLIAVEKPTPAGPPHPTLPPGNGWPPAGWAPLPF